LSAPKVEFERVALVYGELLRRKAAAQARDQVAIDLDHVQVIDALQQGLGKRPQAGTDFHHRVACPRRYGIDDLANDARRHQEVLPEALARSEGIWP
jgi:hypothetical protein